MKFSVWPSYNRSWDETITLARFAETNGFDGFWYADHLMPYTEDGAPDQGDAHECWTVLAAVGALVPRLRLVSMVSPVSIHHPVLLTKRAISVDHVSGGRAVLGLGAGWQENEHSSYGFPLLDPGPRVSRFEEAIQIVRGLRDQPSTTLHGTHYSVTDAPCSPKPVGPLPLLVGTGSLRMLRLTARWADEWNTWGGPDEVAVRLQRFQDACDAVGRDPDTMRRSVQALVFLGDPDPAAPAARTVSGTPQQLVDQLNRYVEMGVHEFAILDDPLGDTPAERMDNLDRFHAEVMPHVG
ncbi:MAG: LLM class flavin-dependent oxidoreductase [Actinobacteria bacterium]|nr:LLM class flavin-dependent oxidoreductase [Actinomycetota bacterium]